MFAVHLHIFILSWKNYHLWTFMFVYCHLPITYFTPGVLVGVHVAHVVLCFFLCPIMCLYVLSYNFRIQTMAGSSIPQVVCFIYIIWLCLCIVVFNTHCVVFFFVLLTVSLECPFLIALQYSLKFIVIPSSNGIQSN